MSNVGNGSWMKSLIHNFASLINLFTSLHVVEKVSDIQMDLRVGAAPHCALCCCLQGLSSSPSPMDSRSGGLVCLFQPFPPAKLDCSTNLLPVGDLKTYR